MAAELGFALVILVMAAILGGSFLLFRGTTKEHSESPPGGLSRFKECYDSCVQNPSKASGDCAITCAHTEYGSRWA